MCFFVLSAQFGAVQAASLLFSSVNLGNSGLADIILTSPTTAVRSIASMTLKHNSLPTLRASLQWNTSCQRVSEIQMGNGVLAVREQSDYE